MLNKVFPLELPCRDSGSVTVTLFIAQKHLMETKCAKFLLVILVSHLPGTSNQLLPYSSHDPVRQTQLSVEALNNQPQQSHRQTPCALVRHPGCYTITARQCSRPNDGACCMRIFGIHPCCEQSACALQKSCAAATLSALPRRRKCPPP